MEDALVATYTYRAEYEARRRKVESAVNAALQLEFASVVELYKALGGGWPVQPETQSEAD